MNDTANHSANTGPEEKVLERVRALLAKAEGTDYPAEAETYAAKAAELMARHGVEQAMLDARDGGTDPVESREIAVSDPYRMVKAVLLKSVAEGLHCAMFYFETKIRVRGKVIRVENPRGIVWGRSGDLERVEFLYTALLLQAQRMAAQARPPAGSDAGVRAYRRSWLMGFAERIEERLTTATREAVADSAPGAESVLADRRGAAERARDQAHPDVPERTITGSCGAGHRAGRAAGSLADLAQARVRGTRGALDR